MSLKWTCHIVVYKKCVKGVNLRLHCFFSIEMNSKWISIFTFVNMIYLNKQTKITLSKTIVFLNKKILQYELKIISYILSFDMIQDGFH